MLSYHLLTVLACIGHTWAGQNASTALVNTTDVMTVSNAVPVGSFHNEKGGGDGGGGDGGGDGGNGDSDGDSGGSSSTSSGGKAPAGASGAHSGVRKLSRSKWLVTSSLLAMAANQQYGPIALTFLIIRTFVEARGTFKAEADDAALIAKDIDAAPVVKRLELKDQLSILSSSWLLAATSASTFFFLLHDRTALLGWYLLFNVVGLDQAESVELAAETPSPTEIVQYDISGIHYTTAWTETTMFTILPVEPTLESTIGELLTIYAPDSTATSEVVGIDPSNNVVVVFGQGIARGVSWYLPSGIFVAMAALYFGIFPMIIFGILRFANAAQLETIDQALQKTQSSQQSGLGTGSIIGIVDGTLAAIIILWVGSAGWRAGWSWDGTLKNLYIRPWPPWARGGAHFGPASGVALIYFASLPLFLFGMLGLTNVGVIDGRDLSARQAITN